MSLMIFTGALFLAHMMLAIAMLMSAVRILFGPRAQDRVLALDTFYVNSLLFLVTFGIRTGSTLYLEVAMIMALMGFAATVAFAKFLMRGEVIE